MIETKTEWKLLLGFYWSKLNMKFNSRINNAKRKHPTPGKFYLFSFLAGKRQNWWMHWSVGLNPSSFNVLFSNNFSKWVIFGYGEICVQYWYIIPLTMLWWCKTCIELASQVLLAADIEQFTVSEVKCSKFNTSSPGLNLFL